MRCIRYNLNDRFQRTSEFKCHLKLGHIGQFPDRKFRPSTERVYPVFWIYVYIKDHPRNVSGRILANGTT